jgi:hypothetical protein
MMTGFIQVDNDSDPARENVPHENGSSNETVFCINGEIVVFVFILVSSNLVTTTYPEFRQRLQSLQILLMFVRSCTQNGFLQVLYLLKRTSEAGEST